jgi:hypothetical protein
LRQKTRNFGPLPSDEIQAYYRFAIITIATTDATS